jgi:hypothetical protein
MSRESAALGGQDLIIEFDDLRLDKLSIPQTYHRLRNIANPLSAEIVPAIAEISTMAFPPSQEALRLPPNKPAFVLRCEAVDR